MGVERTAFFKYYASKFQASKRWNKPQSLLPILPGSSSRFSEHKSEARLRGVATALHSIQPRCSFRWGLARSADRPRNSNKKEETREKIHDNTFLSRMALAPSSSLPCGWWGQQLLCYCETTHSGPLIITAVKKIWWVSFHSFDTKALCLAYLFLPSGFKPRVRGPFRVAGGQSKIL